MNDKKIKVRVRLVIIKNGKILLTNASDAGFYYYAGGKMEFGETVLEACIRETKEETQANFTFKKILYIMDYIDLNVNEHSVELFILGDIDKFEGIEELKDMEYGGKRWQTWVDIDKLHTINLKPKELTDILIADYKSGFSKDTRYICRD